MDLGRMLAPDPTSAPQMRLGVVTQVSPLLVRVGAAVTPVGATALGSYAPRVNDVVSLLEQGPDRLVLGVAGVPSSRPFTPTWTNLAVGDGAVAARFVATQGMVGFNVELTIGSTTSISGNVGVSAVPGFTPARVSSLAVTYEDSGTRYYVGSAANIATLARFELAHSESGNQGLVNASNPFAWTPGDDIVISGVYFT